MPSDRDGRQFRLLTIHGVLWSLAMSMAGGFVGAYLLRQGLGLPTTILVYAMLLLVRFAIRSVMLPVVRRLGMRRSVLLGALIAALQFLPLIHAEQPLWLGVWVLLVASGECIYWPICHAANAMCGGDGRRGQQLAIRQMASTAVSVIGPLIGGVLLTRLGAAAEFGLATVVCLLSTAPLAWMGEIHLGRVPTFGQSLRAADAVGLYAFAADGWISAGTGITWSLILFSSLGSSYGALGMAGSAAAVAGAVAGLAAGLAIDRGHRRLLSRWVNLALLGAVLLRVVSAWAPWAAFDANVVGSAVSGLYYPVLMSVVYDRAKRSGSAYQFHLSTEAGWDGGAILGCIAAAAVAWTGVPATLAVLPSALGVLVVDRCVRAECRLAAAEGPRLADVVEGASLPQAA